MENVKEQYKNASNLDIRIRIHEQYSTNQKDWHEWLFEQYEIPPNSRILELGCGSAAFWIKNKSRIRNEWNITLSDFSLGMLKDAQTHLQDVSGLSFKQIDVETIPFAEETFDVVIANHMLYHVPNRQKALSEIRRILKPSGVFYSSTIGLNHLKEFGDLISNYTSKLDYGSAYSHAEAFGLENGERQLKPFFDSVTLKSFPGDLNISNTDAIITYILSSETPAAKALYGETLCGFKQYLEKQKEKNGGYIHITKASGLFVSR
ncbi:class I SAM-dependent methyltransferase [Fictibacillus nanhaiensis]|uniref:class I SAM-dependent methyltransferase n=1 Tax=Fictibacillus nanhaiensis TaxID=742169 RepID=UPI001C9585EC|nr:class I SAM-dependent methyltransferase [Fictibacillus nanhaiensis]MBY6037728.1 class I SAM-dependent methyltransferase [Fictibacillus nanhaiensis]